MQLISALVFLTGAFVCLYLFVEYANKIQREDQEQTKPHQN